MELHFQKVYKFNLKNNKPEELVVDKQAADFNEYLEQIIIAVLDDNRSKRFLFPDDATATKMGINQILEGEKAEAALSFAKRLSRIESDVQNRIEHLEKEVQKGILIQALVTSGKKTYFLIIKAEHTDFINESDNKRTTGLPIKKKIFKAFKAQIGEKSKVKYAHVSDYRSSISTYWWRDFLELQEEYTDEYNTEMAFKAIEGRVLNRLEAEHPSDYMYLRNATVQYFRSRNEFVLADYVDDLITHYEPEDQNLDIQDLRTRIEGLPEKAGFDGRFNIKKEKIRKRIIKKLTLSDQLDLVIKENISWGESVRAIKVDGAKYIRIRTNEGYDHFNKQ